MTIPTSFEKFAEKSVDPEAVLQRLGAGTYDLVLIDSAGNWERVVVPTEAEARSFCERSQIPVHDGWDDPALARRIDSLDVWSTPGAKRRAL